MFKKTFLRLFTITTVFFLTGCANSFDGFDNDFKQKESLYQTTENHVGLISLYRDSLQKNEDDEIRYKLSQSYYKNGDSESALLYLKPLLAKDSKVAKAAKILQIQALIQETNYQAAIENATALIQADPKNGEAYNLRGIAYAQQGDFENSRKDIVSARENFINDTVAINNLATLHILNEQYAKAVELLMPQYLNDVKESKLVHNLVFALVKNGQIDEAKSIVQKENLAPDAEALINSLSRVKKAPFITNN